MYVAHVNVHQYYSVNWQVKISPESFVQGHISVMKVATPPSLKDIRVGEVLTA
jgi:hypothetical protein